MANYIIKDAESDKPILLLDQKAKPSETVRILIGTRFNESDPVASKSTDIAKLQQLYRKYQPDTLQANWKRKDFSNTDIHIYNVAMNPWYLPYDKEKFAYLYSCSQPIKISNKTIAFYLSKGEGMGRTIYSQVVVLKFRKGDWELAEIVEDNVLY